MLLSELNGTQVCILGFGREGRSALRALKRGASSATVTIGDGQETLEGTEDCTVQLGADWLSNLERFDCIIVSPGVPPLPELKTVQEVVTTGTQIFLDEAEALNATVIGITGSKGKSTTSSLIHHILTTAGKDSRLVGNIGKPSLDALEDADSNTIFVHETSSYQLMRMHSSPHIAVLTSFFPDHLDYHGSLEDYRQAKINLVRWQTPEDFAFYNAESTDVTAMTTETSAATVGYTAKDAPVPLEETKLIGGHNLTNLAGAAMVCRHFECSEETIREAAKTFEPLAHRLQLVGTFHDIHWVDDSISTTPESAVAALKALGNDVYTCIFGGLDRGYDFTPLAEALSQSAVEHVILLPNSGPHLHTACEKVDFTGTIQEVENLQEAVAVAKKNTAKHKICLLSPASPSYNQFKNFEERGKKFAELAQEE